MFERIKKVIGGRKKDRQPGSVFSQQVQKSGYKAPLPESGTRKKKFWQRKKTNGTDVSQQAVFPGKKKPKRVAGSMKLPLVLGGLLAGAYFLLTGPMHSLYDELRYFRIHEIEISGCRTISPEALRKFAAISYEMNMLSLEPKVIQERLLKHDWVKSAKVQRVWPDGLTISIQEHRPQALLIRNDGKELSYVSRSGVVFAKFTKGQELDYPAITGLDSFTVEAQKELLASANLFLRLAERNNPNLPAQNISEIHFTENGEFIIYLVEHPFPIYFGKDGIKRKYLQLRRVLEVLYRKHRRKGRAKIEKVAYILMDYQTDKVLVAQNQKS
jgi:cell division protein FtsQ